MPEIAGLVSVIIPVYNGSAYIAETLKSVQSQVYSQWEIIVVNDGSTDNTSDIIKESGINSFQLIDQLNAGVSMARNKGLDNAKGEFIVFLDADDLMEPGFLSERIDFLKQHPEAGFCGGTIQNFPGTPLIRKAAADNAEKEILFFDAGCATIPSNYLFRRQLLIQHSVQFNTSLSSTADRFFILQLTQYTKGKSIDTPGGKLLYRVNEHSMSHKISRSLLDDNTRFYHELVKSNLLPKENKQRFKTQYFFSLALGFIKIAAHGAGVRYLGMSFFSSPIYFFKLAIKKLFLK